MDTGSLLSIHVGPLAAGPPAEPVLRVPYNSHDFPAARIAIYNREYVGGTNHESHIDNVVVRSEGSG
jgi:hypothetical protein